MKPLLFLLLILTFACKPSFERCKAVYGNTTSKVVIDTVRIEVPGIRADTIVELHHLDTVFLSKERLRVQVVRVRDSLLIRGECLTDTVTKTITKTNNRTVFKEPPFSLKWYHWVVIALFVVLLIVIFRK